MTETDKLTVVGSVFVKRRLSQNSLRGGMKPASMVGERRSSFAEIRSLYSLCPPSCSFFSKLMSSRPSKTLISVRILTSAAPKPLLALTRERSSLV